MTEKGESPSLLWEATCVAMADSAAWLRCPAQEPDEREQRVAQEQAADAGMEKADITQDVSSPVC